MVQSQVASEIASRRLYLVLALVLIAAAALLLHQWDFPAHGGYDENAYLVAGRQIAETGRPQLVPLHRNGSPIPTLVSDMWVGENPGTPGERFLPKYPPAVPLLVAAALRLGQQGNGITLVYLLNPVGFCIGLLGVYLLARVLAGPGPAVVALLVGVASTPVVRMFSIPGSHGISFALTSMAAYCLAQWLTSSTWRHAILAGVLCALAAAARSGEIVLVAPLLVAAAMRVRRSRRDLLQSLAMLVGWGAIIALGVGIQYAWSGNWSLYAATGESGAFGVRFLWRHLPIAAEHLLLRGIGLLFPLGLIGLVLLVRRDRALGLSLATWVAANILLYAAYYWAPKSSLNIYGRFFLPSFAPLCACGAAALVWGIRRGKQAGRDAALAFALGSVAILSAGVSLYNVYIFLGLDTLSRLNVQQRSQWLAERVPDDALVFCDEMDVLNHLQFVSNYTLYDSRMFRRTDLTRLVRHDPEEPNSLDAERRRYLTDVLLSRSQGNLTQLRDDLIASYLRAGKRVFIFSGAQYQWEPFSTLEQRGLSLRRMGAYENPWAAVPMIPNSWTLDEVVPR